jgi:hypothetical protein
VEWCLTAVEWSADRALVAGATEDEIANGRQECGYTAAGEIRGDCGDHPDLDYREISPRLQRIRGHHLVADGVAIYEKRLGPEPAARGDTPAGMTDLAARQ